MKLLAGLYKSARTSINLRLAILPELAAWLIPVGNVNTVRLVKSSFVQVMADRCGLTEVQKETAILKEVMLLI
ncbi:hypothetical protein D3C78_1632370 [compost metagenome]